MAFEGGWRETLFNRGQAYLVLKNWSSRGHVFQAGEIVEFESGGYEPYDNESLFRFYKKKGSFLGNEPILWHIHDDEPDSLAHEYFKKVK